MRNRSLRVIRIAVAALTAVIGLGHADMALALMSGATIDFNPSNSADNFQDGTFASFERKSAKTVTNDGTTLNARYSFVNGTDTGLNTDQSNSQTCDYRVQFNVSAPGGYRLTVNTARRGALTRVDDFPGANATADISGVAASYTGTGTFAGGPLTLGDPAASSGGGNANTAFDASTAVATVTGVSNGAAIPQRFDFSWTTFCNSDSSFFLDGGDECAVRGGIAISYSGETAGDYPGAGPRTQTNDGHFLTVTFESLCGNSMIDASVGEQCDDGVANGTTGSCCAANCTFRAMGQVCRPGTGVCDVAEVCTGSSSTCPANGFQPMGFICRAASPGQVCDFEETCSGSGPNCPNDIPQPIGTVCRPSAGVCDLTETCDGVSNFCPADAKSMAVCRPSAGVCDVAESCNGGNNCPADGFANAATPCRPAVDVCDMTENCPGNAANCPADQVKGSGTSCTSDGNPCTDDECDGVSTACQHPAGNTGTPCRASAGACDIVEVCDGSAVCPPDTFEPSTTVCRAASPGELCDESEFCPGGSPTCPPDAVLPMGSVCRATAGDCDIAETCDGSSKLCPSDGFVPSSTECRASAGVCDLAENCTGSTATCPTNGFVSSSTPCRIAVGDCDITENCTGSSANCPVDAIQPNGASCRASAGLCDVAEQCDGLSTACPADGFASSSTPCRPAGTCDIAENCTGSGAICPADVLEPDGTDCSDPLFCNGAESCTSGTCQSAAPACSVGQNCDESSDLCFTGGCPANAVMCRAAQKSILVIKDKTDDSKDKLVWKWIKGANTSQAEFADPITTANYALCFYSGPSASLIDSADVGPGSDWTPISTKGYKYKDATGAQSGVKKIVLKGSTTNKSKALVKGKGTGLPDFTLPIPPGDLPLIVQLRNNQTGVCWEGVFATPLKNVAGLFKDKTP